MPEAPTSESKAGVLGLEVNHTKLDPLDPSISTRRTRKSPPQHADAEYALQKINKLLRPPRKTGPGYKKCKLDPLTQSQYQAMASCLHHFLRSSKKTFTDASSDATIGAGHSIWYACRIRVWVQRFIATGQLPVSKYRRSRHSLLHDEDIAGEIGLFLQRTGKYVVASDIVRFLDDPKTRQRLTLTKGITVKTAQCWLCGMQYRRKTEKSGQYIDGHEREDVVLHRQHVYAPKMQALNGLIMSWDGNGLEKPPNLQP
ncbi:hypothetical protein FRC06_006327, partial [Ceratobasidium sp. 370]